MDLKRGLASIIILLLLVSVKAEGNTTIYFIYSDLCPHCGAEKPVINDLERSYPGVGAEYINIAAEKEYAEEINGRYGVNRSGTPQTYVGRVAFIGFTEDADFLLYSRRYNAYIGNREQIEQAVLEEVYGGGNMTRYVAVDKSMNDSLTGVFLVNNSDSYATVNLSDGVYLVAWWSKKSLSSGIDYPNVLVKIDSGSGEVMESFKPSHREAGVVVPSSESMLADFIVYFLVFIYLVSYLMYLRSGEKIKKRFRIKKIGDREWLMGFLIMLLLSITLLIVAHPKEGVGYLVRFIKRLFPFYIFGL